MTAASERVHVLPDSLRQDLQDRCIQIGAMLCAQICLVDALRAMAVSDQFEDILAQIEAVAEVMKEKARGLSDRLDVVSFPRADS